MGKVSRRVDRPAGRAWHTPPQGVRWFSTRFDAIVLDGLRRNATFQALAFPKRVLLPLFNRYEPGMHYGAHLDATIMGASPAVGAARVRERRVTIDELRRLAADA